MGSLNNLCSRIVARYCHGMGKNIRELHPTAKTYRLYLHITVQP